MGKRQNLRGHSFGKARLPASIRQLPDQQKNDNPKIAETALKINFSKTRINIRSRPGTKPKKACDMKNLFFSTLAVSLLTIFVTTNANARQVCLSKSASSSYVPSKTKRIAKSSAIANWNRRVQKSYYGNASLNWNNAHNKNISYSRRSGGHVATVSGRICVNRPKRR